MRGFSKVIWGLLIGVSLSACSTQWHDADPAISQGDFNNILGQVFGPPDGTGGLSSTGGANLSQAASLAYDPNATVFFADSIAMGPPASVVAFSDLSYLGLNVALSDISQISVFFMDRDNGDGTHSNALAINYVAGGDQGPGQTVVWSGQGQVADGQFVVDLQGDSGRGLQLVSDDVDRSGNLKSAIQLRAYDMDPETGESVVVGKFPVLAGFR